MQSKCDILILTAGFGNGHHSVSQAIETYIHENNPNIVIHTVDLYKILNPLFYKGMYKAYGILVKKGYKLYNMYYYKKHSNHTLQIIDKAAMSQVATLAKYLDTINPSIIISTFPTCTGYVSKYKENYNKDILLLTCVTDVVDSDEWLYEHNDIYFVASKDVKEKLMAKGIEACKIVITGIPIRKSFIQKRDKREIRQEFGYQEDDFIVLMVGGGLGLLPEDITFYKWLDGVCDVKVIVLTGKNKHLHKKLHKIKFKNIKVIEYSEQIPELMTISDVLVGKAGGITLFEAIASHLPLIIYKPILGQELENCKFIQKKGIGVITENQEELKATINKMIVNHSFNKEIKEKLQLVGSTINMEALASKILDLYKGEKNVSSTHI